MLSEGLLPVTSLLTFRVAAFILLEILFGGGIEIKIVQIIVCSLLPTVAARLLLSSEISLHSPHLLLYFLTLHYLYPWYFLFS